MNLNPVNQLFLYGHHFEFCNFIDLYKNKKLPNKPAVVEIIRA